jgi:hypothetical protein
MKFYLTLSVLNAAVVGAQLAIGNYGGAAFSGCLTVFCALGAYAERSR